MQLRRGHCPPRRGHEHRVDAESCVEYIAGDYTVCGRIEAMGYEIDLPDRPPVSVVYDGFLSPNEQPGDSNSQKNGKTALLRGVAGGKVCF